MAFKLFGKKTYIGNFWCQNCGQVQEINVSKGKTLREAEESLTCENCGVDALKSYPVKFPIPERREELKKSAKIDAERQIKEQKKQIEKRRPESPIITRKITPIKDNLSIKPRNIQWVPSKLRRDEPVQPQPEEEYYEEDDVVGETSAEDILGATERGERRRRDW